MKSYRKYKAIGLMSGTSLDGLDIAFSEYVLSKGNKWNYKLVHSASVNYPGKIRDKLKIATDLNAEELLILDVELGKFFGEQINNQLKQCAFHADFIASHGHTIFHQPEKSFTWQIGNPYVINNITGYSVISDFRSRDVSLGGQGAPLVPIGDRHLFSDYHACVNLGGISNISYEENGRRIAFDICPVNMILNYLAAKLDLDYDKNGQIAAKGHVNPDLLKQLIATKKLKESERISLGYEWVSQYIFPLLNTKKWEIADLLATSVEFISNSISEVLNTLSPGKVLITGGGVFNHFLMERLNSSVKQGISLLKPQKEIVNYKEAIIFGFLGVLKMRNEVNCLSSVTGAIKDSVGGLIIEN